MLTALLGLAAEETGQADRRQSEVVKKSIKKIKCGGVDERGTVLISGTSLASVLHIYFSHNRSRCLFVNLDNIFGLNFVEYSHAVF